MKPGYTGGACLTAFAWQHRLQGATHCHRSFGACKPGVVQPTLFAGCCTPQVWPSPDVVVAKLKGKKIQKILRKFPW